MDTNAIYYHVCLFEISASSNQFTAKVTVDNICNKSSDHHINSMKQINPLFLLLLYIMLWAQLWSRKYPNKGQQRRGHTNDNAMPM